MVWIQGIFTHLGLNGIGRKYWDIPHGNSYGRSSAGWVLGSLLFLTLFNDVTENLK